MYQDNGWYGNRFIFSLYSKVKEKVAFASIQHGYMFLDIMQKQKRRKIESAPWLVWNKTIHDRLIKDGHKNIVITGAPFIYLDKLLKRKKTKPKGTLIIPTKSAAEINTIVDYKKLLKFSKKKCKGPYTILVGYADLKRIAKIKKSFRNCRFVTCGKRGNKFFTFNLYNFISKNKNIILLYPGSPLFYSIFLKKKTFYFNKRFLKNMYGKGVNYNQKKQIKLLEQEDKEIVNSIKNELNIDFKNLNTKKNYERAKKALGARYIKPKTEIIRLLGWNNLLKIVLAKVISIIIDILKPNTSRNY